MRAAAHALAVRVEHQRGDIGHAVLRHRLGQPPLEPLDGEAGGDLAEKAPGVRKSGLDRHPSVRAGVGAVGVFPEQRIEQSPAMFERLLGLEQRRDVDLVGDPEQVREVECDQHRRWLFAFGDQHADRGVGIDVLEDFRHRQELADRGRALDRQRGEIGAQRLRFRQAACVATRWRPCCQCRGPAARADAGAARCGAAWRSRGNGPSPCPSHPRA